MLDPTANFARSTLSNSPGTEDTTFTLTDASAFPDPSTEGEYNITVYDGAQGSASNDPNAEICRVTAKSTNDLTVTRAQEGTTAQDYSGGGTFRVIAGITAKMFSDIDTGKTTIQETAKTITVGSGGDHSTLEAALAEASRLTPLYASGGTSIEISLLTGFALNEAIYLKNIDLSHVVITSVDAEVNANPGAGNNLFRGENAKMPVIDCLFNQQGNGNVGLTVVGGEATIKSGAGIKNTGGNGINGQNSIIQAEGAIFTGAGILGINADRGTWANCQSSDFSGSANSSYRVANGGYINRSEGSGTNSQTANKVTRDGIILDDQADNQVVHEGDSPTFGGLTLDATSGIMEFVADAINRGAIRFRNDVGILWDVQIRSNESLRFLRVGGTGNLEVINGPLVTNAGIEAALMPTVGGDAIVESGSNSDGGWVKWPAVGRMKVYKKQFTLSYQTGERLFAAWSLPQAFANTGYTAVVTFTQLGYSATPAFDELSVIRADVGNSSVLNIWIYRQAGQTDFVSGDTLDVNVTAIGEI